MRKEQQTMLTVVFEDQTFENFYPLTLLRPVFELKCGKTMLHEKITRALKPEKVCYFTRAYLTRVLKDRLDGAEVNELKVLSTDDLLLINGRWLFIDVNLEPEGEEEAGIDQDSDTLLYARIKQQTARECLADTFKEFIKKVVSRLKVRNIQADVISYPWDLIVNNARAIIDDFKQDRKSGVKGRFDNRAALIGEESQIYVAPSAEVQPFVTIDTTGGPVTIDERTIVHPNSWISGPVYVGQDTLIMGGKVREGTSIGPVSRIGGEVEESIAHGYVNKWHDGFLGHSYVGEFVNLGASTNNSDVKNDFGNIQVYMKGEFVDTGQWKLGSFIGDHVKTSIGTLLNTGSSIGVMCIILGGDGILSKFVPSFSWYINRKITKGFGFGKLIESANGLMSKRDRQLTEDEIEVLKKAYEICKPERDMLIKKDRRAQK